MAKTFKVELQDKGQDFVRFTEEELRKIKNITEETHTQFLLEDIDGNVVGDMWVSHEEAEKIRSRIDSKEFSDEQIMKFMEKCASAPFGMRDLPEYNQVKKTILSPLKSAHEKQEQMVNALLRVNIGGIGVLPVAKS